MAGDWIKLEHVTPDKPEVGRMAEILGIDHDAVVGKVVRWLIWADQNVEDRYAVSVTKALLDRITFQPGFADALVTVGWLAPAGDFFYVPNFDRHNGKPAKQRALAKNRNQALRSERNERYAASVTNASLEKRREECNKRESARAGESSDSGQKEPDAEIPSLEEVKQEGEARNIPAKVCQAFFDHYDGLNLWRNQFGNPIKWRSRLSAWNTREQEKNHASSKNGSRPRVDRRTGTLNADVDPEDYARFDRLGT